MHPYIVRANLSVMRGEISLQAPVFVSYSSLDEKQALDLVDALEQRSVVCWVAKRDIKVGENYADKIPEVIGSAPAFVLVYSCNADSSPEVKKELQLASSYKKPIFPIRLENVRPTKAFQYELTTVQWIDAFEGWEAGVNQLAKAIDEVNVPGGTGEGSDHPEPLKPTEASHPPKSKVLMATVSGLVGVCIVGALIFNQWRPNFPTHQESQSGGPQPQQPSDRTHATVPPLEPRWETLPSGSNFANLGKDSVSVRRNPDAASDVIVDIAPGSTLFLNGVLPTISRASINNEVWLRLDTQSGPGFVLESSLKALNSQKEVSKSVN